MTIDRTANSTDDATMSIHFASADAPVADEETSSLPALSPLRSVLADYAATRLSLRSHPMAFIRDALTEEGVTPAEELADGERWPRQRQALLQVRKH